MRTAKVREHWASGTVAVQLKTGKKGKLQIKHGSVLATAAGAGSLLGPRVTTSQAEHRGDGGKELVFGDSCLGSQGKASSSVSRQQGDWSSRQQ